MNSGTKSFINEPVNLFYLLWICGDLTIQRMTECRSMCCSCPGWSGGPSPGCPYTHPQDPLGCSYSAYLCKNKAPYSWPVTPFLQLSFGLLFSENIFGPDRRGAYIILNIAHGQFIEDIPRHWLNSETVKKVRRKPYLNWFLIQKNYPIKKTMKVLW